MAPSLRSISQLSRSAITAVAERLASTSKEAARALPSSKGGETPLSLQTYSTQIYTYFTRANGQTSLLYSAENWVKIKLTLETTGPVSIGTAASLEPVLSGRGVLLDTDEQFEAYLAKGTRVYIISETVNRVSVTIEPVPWLEQISNQQNQGVSAIARTVSQAAQAIADAVKAAGAKSTPAAQSAKGTTAAQLPPCPPAPVIQRARLTPIPGRRRVR